MEENGLAPFEGGSESSSRVKADWNCLLQMLACPKNFLFSFFFFLSFSIYCQTLFRVLSAGVLCTLRVSLSDVILNVRPFLSD